MDVGVSDRAIQLGVEVLKQHMGTLFAGPLFDHKEVVEEIYLVMRDEMGPAQPAPRSFGLKLDCADLLDALKAFHDDVNRLCGAMAQAVEDAPVVPA